MNGIRSRGPIRRIKRLRRTTLNPDDFALFEVCVGVHEVTVSNSIIRPTKFNVDVHIASVEKPINYPDVEAIFIIGNSWTHLSMSNPWRHTRMRPKNGNLTLKVFKSDDMTGRKILITDPAGWAAFERGDIQLEND